MLFSQTYNHFLDGKNIRLVSEYKWKSFHFYLEFRILKSTAVWEAPHIPFGYSSKRNALQHTAWCDWCSPKSRELDLALSKLELFHLLLIMRRECPDARRLKMNAGAFACIYCVKRGKLFLVSATACVYAKALVTLPQPFANTPSPVPVCSPPHLELAHVLFSSSIKLKERYK